VARNEHIYRAIPWVRELDKKVACDGFCWSRVSGRRPRGHPANACKVKARWRYRALRNSLARTGNYCTHHLWAHGLFADNPEIDRWHAWAEENSHLFPPRPEP